MANDIGIYWQTHNDIKTAPESICRFLQSAQHGSIFQSPQWCMHTEENSDRYMIIAALRQARPVFASLIRKSWVPGTSSYFGSVQRGPVFDEIQLAIDIWHEYEMQLIQSGICAIEIHPYWERSQAHRLRRHLQNKGYVLSTQNISHTETLILDLSPPEEDLFYSLKSSRRNLIRKAIKIGIRVEPVQNSKEMTEFWQMYRDLCWRKGINYWSYKRFEKIRCFSVEYPDDCICLLGWLNGDLVGGNIILRHSKIVEVARGGGSTRINNSIPKTDLILWESIRWAKRRGATAYDFGGITPNAERGSPEWGINQFKLEFTQKHVSLLKPMEKIFNTKLFRLYNSLRKVKKAVLRHLPMRPPA